MVGKGQPGTCCVCGCWEALHGEGAMRANYECLSSAGGHFLPFMPTAGCESLTGHRPQWGCWRQAGPQHGRKTSTTSSQPQGSQGAVCSSQSLSRCCCTPSWKVFHFCPPERNTPFYLSSVSPGPCGVHLTLRGVPPLSQGWDRGR